MHFRVCQWASSFARGFGLTLNHLFLGEFEVSLPRSHTDESLLHLLYHCSSTARSRRTSSRFVMLSSPTPRSRSSRAGGTSSPSFPRLSRESRRSASSAGGLRRPPRRRTSATPSTRQAATSRSASACERARRPSRRPGRSGSPRTPTPSGRCSISSRRVILSCSSSATRRRLRSTKRYSPP